MRPQVRHEDRQLDEIPRAVLALIHLAFRVVPYVLHEAGLVGKTDLACFALESGWQTLAL